MKSGGVITGNEKYLQEKRSAALLVKKKLTYKEQRELEQLEREIKELESERKRMEDSLCSGNLDPDKLIALSTGLGKVIEVLDEKEMRWLELNE